MSKLKVLILGRIVAQYLGSFLHLWKFTDTETTMNYVFEMVYIKLLI
jgi:hypothetical protein